MDQEQQRDHAEEADQLHQAEEEAASELEDLIDGMAYAQVGVWMIATLITDPRGKELVQSFVNWLDKTIPVTKPDVPEVVAPPEMPDYAAALAAGTDVFCDFADRPARTAEGHCEFCGSRTHAKLDAEAVGLLTRWGGAQ